MEYLLPQSLDYFKIKYLHSVLYIRKNVLTRIYYYILTIDIEPHAIALMNIIWNRS